MTETILQSYLNEQHIRTDVKENIDSLKKVVNEVKKYLGRKKSKSDIIPFTLVAFDPKVSDIDPVVQLVEGFIIKKWAAFKNSVTATKDKSTTYIRAVILESLSQLAKEDAATAALIWLTARDVVLYYHIGSEENIIRDFLQQLADQTEKNGQSMLEISNKFQANEFKGVEVSISGVKSVVINNAALKQSLLDAMVHSAWNTQGGGGKNPRPQSHGNWEWPKFAAEHSAQGISEVVNSALSEQGKSLSSMSSSIQKSLDAYFAQIQPFFQNLNTSFATSITANNKRSELIWWKQSLYSPSLNTSYRSLDGLNKAICMALDLVQLVEAIYPESVDYLLRETIKSVHSEQAEEEHLLTDWINDLNCLQVDIQTFLKKNATDGYYRKPLHSAWANVLQLGETTQFLKETGIDKQAKLTLSDLAVWIFHGLQAHKLATAK